jgi:hypothetical protein
LFLILITLAAKRTARGWLELGSDHVAGVSGRNRNDGHRIGGGRSRFRPAGGREMMHTGAELESADCH